MKDRPEDTHQIKGAQILSAVRSLNLPHLVLGADLVENLEKVDEDSWYPFSWFSEIVGRLERKMGPGGMRKLGRTFFAVAFEPELRGRAQSARDVLYGFDAMYR